MKDIKLKVLTIIFFSSFAIGEHHHEHEYKYPCGNKFYRYYFDDEPAEYGLKGGEYEEDKEAYVALVDVTMSISTGRLQLDPPGMYMTDFNDSSITKFINDSSHAIYYLYRNRHHKYEWVDAQFGEIVPFGIDIGAQIHNTPCYFGRAKINGFYQFGPIVSLFGIMFYPGKETVQVTPVYQVLTCKSRRKNETKTVMPMPKITLPRADVSGCINKWAEYKGEDSVNGVSAGLYDCGNTAYVGKGCCNNFTVPGRIQTVGNKGLYLAERAKAGYLPNGSYYLVDNPNYSYYWVAYNWKTPSNAVLSRSPPSPVTTAIGRLKINGHMQIGFVVDPVGNFLTENGFITAFTNFEILVCDPWPKFQCNHEWKKFNLDNGPTADGFSLGNSYIGRTTSKCVNGCDYEIGKIQISSSNSSGIFYLDELTADGKFDNKSAEYLVKNVNFTYKWIPSRNGIKVENALELHKEGHFPFYIGSTKINDEIFIGKVKPGEGLFFVDSNGKLGITSSYEVLTCTQPDSSLGIYEEKKDEDWFGSFGCSKRKVWSFKKWKCICKEEFKNIFVGSGAKWIESSCSYEI